MRSAIARSRLPTRAAARRASCANERSASSPTSTSEPGPSGSRSSPPALERPAGRAERLAQLRRRLLGDRVVHRGARVAVLLEVAARVHHARHREQHAQLRLRLHLPPRAVIRLYRDRPTVHSCLEVDLVDRAVHVYGIARTRVQCSSGPFLRFACASRNRSAQPSTLTCLTRVSASAPRGTSLRHGRARADIRVAPDGDRRDELAIRADERARLDRRLVLADAVVVARDRARADVRLLADRRVAEVREVVGLRARHQVRLLGLDEVAEACVLVDPRARPAVRERPDLRALADRAPR